MRNVVETARLVQKSKLSKGSRFLERLQRVSIQFCRLEQGWAVTVMLVFSEQQDLLWRERLYRDRLACEVGVRTRLRDPRPACQQPAALCQPRAEQPCPAPAQ